SWAEGRRLSSEQAIAEALAPDSPTASAPLQTPAAPPSLGAPAAGHAVFVSYSSQDAAVAEEVCAALEVAGIGCWMAPRDVPPGVPNGEALAGAIAASRALLLVLSSAANASGQVRREVERAASRDIPILPLRVEEVLPS